MIGHRTRIPHTYLSKTLGKVIYDRPLHDQDRKSAHDPVGPVGSNKAGENSG